MPKFIQLNAYLHSKLKKTDKNYQKITKNFRQKFEKIRQTKKKQLIYKKKQLIYKNKKTDWKIKNKKITEKKTVRIFIKIQITKKKTEQTKNFIKKKTV